VNSYFSSFALRRPTLFTVKGPKTDFTLTKALGKHTNPLRLRNSEAFQEEIALNRNGLDFSFADMASILLCFACNISAKVHRADAVCRKFCDVIAEVRFVYVFLESISNSDQTNIARLSEVRVQTATNKYLVTDSSPCTFSIFY
jgi:hypothetical protein